MWNYVAAVLFCSASKNFINNANAWFEQREFISLTLEALSDHPVLKRIRAELGRLAAATPDLSS